MGLESLNNTLPYFRLNNSSESQKITITTEKGEVSPLTEKDNFSYEKPQKADLPFNRQAVKSGIDFSVENRKIDLKNYDDSQGKNQDIDQFKKDITLELKTSQENIEVIHSPEGFRARKINGDELIEINFKDKKDLNRFSNYLNVGSTVNLVKFGQEEFETGKKITLENYEDGLSRESHIQLFKADMSRLLSVPVELVEIHLDGNNIIALNNRTRERFKVEFDDSADYERFLKYAKQSKSKRLADFGVKKQEISVSLGAATKFPGDFKENTNLLQEVNYSTFLGKEAQHRIKVDLRTDLSVVNPSVQNIKDLTITYQNTDMPFTGTYGDLKVSFREGKFGVDGKYEYLDLQADKFVKKLKEGDPTSIIILASAAAVVAGGVLVAKDKLAEPKDIPLPLKARVYSNGRLQVNAEVKPTVSIGGGKVSFDLNSSAVEVKHNIASGTDVREKVAYDFDQKKLNSELEVNFDRTNLRINNETFIENPESNNSNITIGKSHTVYDGVNINYSYQQNLDSKLKATNQSVNFGVEYTPNDNLRINTGAGINLPKDGEKIQYSVSARATYRF